MFDNHKNYVDKQMINNKKKGKNFKSTFAQNKNKI